MATLAITANERLLESYELLKPGVTRVRLMEDHVEMERIANESGYAWDERVAHMNGNVYTIVDNDADKECYIVYDPVSDTEKLQAGKIFVPYKCVSVLKEETEAQYAIAKSKALVGAVRFFLESVLQSAGQALFLIKTWHSISLSSRLFTMSSICAGLLLSVMGPVKEVTKAVRFKKDSSSPEYDPLLQAEPLRRKSLKKEKMHFTLEFSEDWQDILYQKLEAWKAENDMSEDQWHCIGLFDQSGEELALDGVTNPKQFPIRLTYLKASARRPAHGIGPIKSTMDDFLTGGGSQSTMARTVLISSNLTFWGAMLFIYLHFDFECGETPPATADLTFALVSSVCLLVEIWVAMHTLRGFTMLVYKKAMTITNVVLSIMARYDTYGDITSARVIQACDPITWVSVHGHVYQLHFELSSVMNGALLLVVLFQVLPFFYLLLTRKQVLVAAKLGELNVLLAAMENEAQEPGV